MAAVTTPIHCAGRFRTPLHLLLIVVAAWTIGAVSESRAQSRPSPEYRVKAVFLYHFTQFVEWPDSAFESATAPIVIGVLGEDPFGDFLDETVAGELVRGRPIRIQRFTRSSQIGVCHVLFVSGSQARRMQGTFRTLSGKPILTVGDADEFADEGGMVQFVTSRGRIRLRINVQTVRDAGLTISSRLLNLADIVGGSGS